MATPDTTVFSANAPAGSPEVSYPQPDRLITGNPRRDTWNAIDGPLGEARQISAGVWRCEPGRWRIVFGPAEQEVFTVLSGRCRVHDEAGGFKEAGPGEAIHIPAGFTGSFEVLEAMTKTYVTVEGGDSMVARARRAWLEFWGPPWEDRVDIDRPFHELSWWGQTQRAFAGMWADYHWTTRTVTLALALLAILGSVNSYLGEPTLLQRLFQADETNPVIRFESALTSDPFLTLLALAVALFVGIAIKRRQLLGQLDGDEHYNIGRALAYGYFKNFLVGALILARRRQQPLYVFKPESVRDLHAFESDVWPTLEPRRKEIVEVKDFELIDQKPLPRRIIVIDQVEQASGTLLFDFPTTLFTVGDYYKSWNRWEHLNNRAGIAEDRIPKLQQMQINSFFRHVNDLGHSEAGREVVPEFGLADARELAELFDRHLVLVSLSQLRTMLALPSR